MIADLKADSDRWDAERRQTASRGQPLNGISSRDSNGMVRNSNTPIVEYRSSTTHQSRQYYGPTTDAAPPATQGYGAAPTYASAGSGAQPGGYDGGYQTAQYAQPPAVYADPGYAAQGEYYVAGADLTVDQRSGRAPVQQPGTVPRTGQVQYANSYQQPDSRAYPAYPAQQAPSPVSYAQGSAQQPSEPFYGRGAYSQTLSSQTLQMSTNLSAPPTTGSYGEPASGIYDSRAYQDSGPYSQAQVPGTTASSGPSRRDRERESDRDRHHRSSRR